MLYEYNIKEIKDDISDEQIYSFLEDLGAEPRWQNGAIINKTICHCGESHKLYYYCNSKLFRCYTECGSSFDIFELVLKIMQREQGSQIELPQAIQYVAQYFGYAPTLQINNKQLQTDKDFTYIENYDRIKNISLDTQTVELKAYDDKFLKNFPCPIITPWIEDGISQEIMDYYEICYDPKNCGIVIPHRDIDGRLIGIRERTLIKEQAEKYGKYMPMQMGKKMYNHPLSFNLYGLYQNKKNIKKIKKAIVLESEKACLQYATMFEQENNIAVAICGSAFINYQAWLLINLGVNEIIVGLDHDFTDVNSEEAKRKIKNLKSIHKKYGQYVTISFLWDKENLLSLKASPTDEGKDKFLYLFKNRINIY